MQLLDPLGDVQFVGELAQVGQVGQAHRVGQRGADRREPDGVPLQVDHPQVAGVGDVPQEARFGRVVPEHHEVAQRVLPGRVRPDPGQQPGRHRQRGHHPGVDPGQAFSGVPVQPLGELAQPVHLGVRSAFGNVFSGRPVAREPVDRAATFPSTREISYESPTGSQPIKNTLRSGESARFREESAAITNAGHANSNDRHDRHRRRAAVGAPGPGLAGREGPDLRESRSPGQSGARANDRARPEGRQDRDLGHTWAVDGQVP